MDSFTSILKDIRVAYTGRIFLTIQNHIINPEQDNFIKTFNNNKTLFNEMLSNKKNSKYIEIEGEDCFISCAPLSNTGMHLVGAVKLEEFEFNSNPLLNAIIITSIITIIISLATLFFTSSVITKPIIKLAHTMETFNINNTKDVHVQTND